MNQPTITGSTDSNGLFTAKNPYTAFQSLSEYHKFKKSHPPLFCYNENNDLVKGVEGLEVKGPCYQFLSEDWSSGKKIQTWVNGNDGDRPFPTYKSYSKYWNDRKFETRQVYIAVQPTEKAKSDINNMLKNETILDLEAPYNTDKDTTPLPEAKPLEGVKTAEETLSDKEFKTIEQLMVEFQDKMHYDTYPSDQQPPIYKIEYLTSDYFPLHMVKSVFEAYHAQFATDAGAGKESELREALQQATDFMQQWAQEPKEVEVLKRCKSLLTAPAPHSSSEMVERLTSLIETIKGFEITGDVEVDEDLYNQGLERGVKEINKLITQILTIKR